MVKVSHSLHQLWRWRHWMEERKTCFEHQHSFDFCAGFPCKVAFFISPLSVSMCRQRVTRVSAPLGQFSTNSSSSGEFIPIPRIWNDGENVSIQLKNDNLRGALLDLNPLLPSFLLLQLDPNKNNSHKSWPCSLFPLHNRDYRCIVSTSFCCLWSESCSVYHLL